MVNVIFTNIMQEEYFVIGVMSGTSLDGVDLAYLCFEKRQKWEFKILETETVFYNKDWKKKLKQAIEINQKQLLELNKQYTSHLALIINDFIIKNEIKKIDAICSHGHTILHQPENGITLQIGNLSKIAKLLKQQVICDFRVQDVALGGQGAPLVPIGDHLLFSEYDYCLNLGGFSNVSTLINTKRVAFDISPVNIVLNHYVEKLGYEFDDKGKEAASGNICQSLLNKLDSIKYYSLHPPKSLGLEWVKKQILPLLNSYDLPIKDVLRTFIEHVAKQIGRQFKENIRVLVTGGGVYNDFLMDRIRFYTKATLFIPEKQIIEFKEALIFGFLGVLRLRNEINTLASVTGAQKNHSSGIIYQYNNN